MKASHFAFLLIMAIAIQFFLLFHGCQLFYGEESKMPEGLFCIILNSLCLHAEMRYLYSQKSN